ncbi:N-terminal EF-hand calcium-binding protein 1, partial [Nestor notabilis]
IFRRADKNDDGKLSFEEFKNYFADGILSSEELWELFSGIDRRHSDNVDTEKLCDYFSAYLGEYRNVLSALEALNSAVLAAMDKTKLRYESSSKMEQFLTRFLLRETLQQLQSLQASLECAVDTVEEQSGRDRKDIKKLETSVGLRSGRRCGRRGQKNICLSPTDPYSGMLTTGICSRVIPWGRRGHVVPGDTGPLSLHSTSWWRRGRSRWQPAASRSSARPSGPTRRARPGRAAACRRLLDHSRELLWPRAGNVPRSCGHLQSSCSKTFQRSISSLLEAPELLTTMLFPASWWIMNNN